MKNPDKKNGGFVDRIVFMGIALLLLGGFAMAQIAVRYDPSNNALTEPVAADFFATNQPPLSSLTNALENWTGNTNLATAAQGQLAESAVQATSGTATNLTLTGTTTITSSTVTSGTFSTAVGNQGPRLLGLDGSFTNVFPYYGSDGVPTVATITSQGRNLLDDTSFSAMRTTLELGNSATFDVGTTAGTVAAGDDSRITGAAQLVGDNSFTGNQSVTGNLTVNGTSTFNGDGTLGGNWTYKGVPMVEGSDVLPGQAVLAISAGSADHAQELSDANSYYTALMRSSGVWSGDLSGLTLALDAATANRTIPGNLTVNGTTTLGDASGDTLTINAGTVVAPNANGTNTTDMANVGTLDGRYARKVYFAYKPSTTSRNSTTTLTDDPDLIFSEVRVGIYLVTIKLQVYGDTNTGGLAWDVSGSATMSAMGRAITTPALESTTYQTGIITIPLSGQSVAAWNNSTRNALITFLLQVTASGSVKFRWAQETSNTGSILLYQGTFFRLEKVN